MFNRWPLNASAINGTAAAAVLVAFASFSATCSASCTATREQPARATIVGSASFPTTEVRHYRSFVSPSVLTGRSTLATTPVHRQYTEAELIGDSYSHALLKLIVPAEATLIASCSISATHSAEIGESVITSTAEITASVTRKQYASGSLSAVGSVVTSSPDMTRRPGTTTIFAAPASIDTEERIQLSGESTWIEYPDIEIAGSSSCEVDSPKFLVLGVELFNFTEITCEATRKQHAASEFAGFLVLDVRAVTRRGEAAFLGSSTATAGAVRTQHPTTFLSGIGQLSNSVRANYRARIAANNTCTMTGAGTRRTHARATVVSTNYMILDGTRIFNKFAVLDGSGSLLVARPTHYYQGRISFEAVAQIEESAARMTFASSADVETVASITALLTRTESPAFAEFNVEAMLGVVGLLKALGKVDLCVDSNASSTAALNLFSNDPPWRTFHRPAQQTAFARPAQQITFVRGSGSWVADYREAA